MHHSLFSSRTTPRPGALRRGALLVLLSASALAAPAYADLVPSPPPECTGKPDGTFCSQGDGTAGLCATAQDTRRPGRSYRTCRKDTTECDRLAVGSVCHGYLGKPSHCREFHSAERNEHWRTCQADDIAAAPGSPAAGSPSAVPAPSVSEPAPPGAAAPPTAASKPKGMFGCSQTGGGPTGGWGLLMALLSLGVLRGRRRFARAR